MMRSPAPLPAPVDRAAIAEEAAKQRADELRRRKGRTSTILTGTEGLPDETALVNRPTLLGE